MNRLREFGRLKLIAIGAGMLVVIAVACCGVSSLLPDSADVATAIPVAPTQAPTATPTDAPPTATPMETPIATPEPTDTPIPEPTATATPPETPAQVISVTDGDTIVVEIDGVTYPVRYIGMDTPEIAGEWLAAEATDANRALVEGKTVYLEKDISEVDVYDRLLRYVYLADGTFVNAKLVRLGFARAVAYEPDTARQDELVAAEEEARAQGLGLWQVTPVPTETPIPPTAEATAAPTEPLAPVGAVIRIVKVEKGAEYVDIQNQGDAAQELGGWVLLSERGDQACALGGVIGPGETLRIWAMAEDAGQGGFNCGFGTDIWNNSKSDPAVLYDAEGQEVSRY